MDRVAIIGTGIAGMGCAHFLHQNANVTVYEQEDYVGGHTHTVTVDRNVHIDTGFMVFNRVTYPLLCRLFDDIQAPIMSTDMSFSVQHLPSGLEYSGSSLNHLFAQRRNLFKPSYIRMLGQIARFNRQSPAILDDPHYADYTLGRYIQEKGFGEDMLWKYLIPMSSAVWSTPMDKMLGFPATTLVRFFYNHGFLGLNTQHQWLTLEGGSRSYRDRLIAPFKDRIRTNAKVVRVTRVGDSAAVRTNDGHSEVFDKVILACHADQALASLANPTDAETRLLSPFKYQLNRAVLHTDRGQMPKKRLAWSSWNYRVREGAPSTIYWMNRLQRVSDTKDYFVSINPQDDLDRTKVLMEIDYEHPLFDLAAVKAQDRLSTLNESGPLYYCGSYFKYGFHEDGFKSAVSLCRRLTGQPIYERT